MKKVVLFLFFAVIGQVVLAQGREESAATTDLTKSVQIYPNPAVDFLTIKFDAPIAKTSKLIFHSIIGSTLDLDHEIEVIDETEIKVRVKDLPTGYYILAIQDPASNSRGIHKFLKR